MTNPTTGLYEISLKRGRCVGPLPTQIQPNEVKCPIIIPLLRIFLQV